ncbi:MAG: tyrosine-type recombinase/integrase [Ktedonobacteraceae bacterium]|nr:tyrosine-type recombinase/integrase [Ktedonobacteraceae bacterium]
MVTQMHFDRIARAIELWLDDKYSLTQSTCTEETYRETLLSLRAYLQERGIDLDSMVPDITPYIQAWAGQRVSTSKRQGDIAPSTYNQRIAAVSSFYGWASAHGVYEGSNPAAQLARATVRKYAKARTLDPQLVRTKLKNIDRSTPRGLRDYVLLQVALNTGRSAREIVSLLWRCVHIDENGIVTLTFERCKGGKTMQDVLDPRLSKVLLMYLHTIYGDQLECLAPQRPIWVSFSDRTYGQAIGAQTIADICENHLGVSTVHTLRHTFALTMDDLGAQTSSIQERLGYESLAATSGYLSSLRRTQDLAVW